MSKLERELTTDNDDARRRVIDRAVADPVEAVARWARLLRDDHPGVRSGAAEMLERIGKRLSESETALQKLTLDPDERVRECAVAALRYVGGRGSVPALVASLADPSPYVRLAGAFSLGRVGGTEAVPALLSAVDDEDHEVMDNAITSLIEIGRPALEYLVDLVEGGDAAERERARGILADFTDRLSRRGLDTYLEDPDAGVRLLAVRAAAGAGEQRLVPVLVRVMHGDPDPEVRVAAVAALATLGGHEAWAALESIASAGTDGDVRAAARSALDRRDAS